MLAPEEGGLSPEAQFGALLAYRVLLSVAREPAFVSSKRRAEALARSVKIQPPKAAAAAASSTSPKPPWEVKLKLGGKVLKGGRRGQTVAADDAVHLWRWKALVGPLCTALRMRIWVLILAVFWRHPELLPMFGETTVALGAWPRYNDEHLVEPRFVGEEGRG